jgi:hypothetical protein
MMRWVERDGVEGNGRKTGKTWNYRALQLWRARGRLVGEERAGTQGIAFFCGSTPYRLWWIVIS